MIIHKRWEEIYVYLSPDLYIKDIILFQKRRRFAKGSVSEGAINFIQFLSGIEQSLKAKTGRKSIFITRSVTSSSSLSDLPFYRGRLSENFGMISTNAQKIGSCVLWALYSPEICTQTFTSFGKKQFAANQKHKPDGSQHTFKYRGLKKHLRLPWLFCHSHWFSKAVASPV